MPLSPCTLIIIVFYFGTTKGSKMIRECFAGKTPKASRYIFTNISVNIDGFVFNVVFNIVFHSNAFVFISKEKYHVNCSENLKYYLTIVSNVAYLAFIGDSPLTA